MVKADVQEDILMAIRTFQRPGLVETLAWLLRRRYNPGRTRARPVVRDRSEVGRRGAAVIKIYGLAQGRPQAAPNAESKEN